MENVLVIVPAQDGEFPTGHEIRKDVYDVVLSAGYRKGYAAGAKELRDKLTETKLELLALKLSIRHPDMMPPRASFVRDVLEDSSIDSIKLKEIQEIPEISL